ncbi:YceI family protein [Chitinophaga varians]|uniref:YceI family protein n=1 Tax=Chitinophaga varians TaxID=2202339 RepID=UPI00165F8680|nr:YceI family protein [Chitinophaga varians]MBC9914533.1 YceI family protein [Chitinophaga varians]
MKQQKFQLVVAQSNIDWVGRKVTGAHNGTIALKDGTLLLQNGQLSGGAFTIDTTSIKILDITDPAANTQFAGHLASDDFFGIEQYPEAYFELTSVEGNHVEGNLTMKGITNTVRFETQLQLNEDSLTATATIIVDRTLFGIRFRSGNFFKDLGDTLIYNDFELKVTLTAQLAEEVILA